MRLVGVEIEIYAFVGVVCVYVKLCGMEWDGAGWDGIADRVLI